MTRALRAALVLLALAGCADAGFEAALAQADANAAAARAREVDALYAFVRKTHPAPFHHNSQQRIEAEVAQLQASAPRMSWPEYVVGVARVLKLVGDAETTLVLPESGPGFETRLPIEVGAAGDGWFVGRVSDTHRDAVGARVIAIEGKPIEEVFETLATFWPHENGMWVKRWATDLLSTPGVLAGSGIARTRDVHAAIAFELELRSGRTRTIEVRPVPRDEQLWDIDKLRVLTLTLTEHPEQRAVSTVYSEHSPKRLEEFASEWEQGVRDLQVVRFILDLRSCFRGDGAAAGPLLDAIEASPLNRRGALFVLIGRGTHGGCQRVATQLERRTQALFVGEPTGSAPNHYGDARSIFLPASKLEVRVATRYFEDSDPSDTRFNLEPDLPAWQKIEDERTGRDAALEAALRYRAPIDARPFDPRERWRTPRRRERVQ